MTIEIKPRIGLNNLNFGVSMPDVEKFLGKPQEIARIDEMEEHKSIVWHYWSSGFSAFFDDNANGKFSCAEIDNKKALLWDQEIFLLTEKEIVKLFNKKGFKEIEIEQQKWGERRVSFDDALVDLYFESEKLISVNFSMPVVQNKIVFFPN